MKFKGKVTPAGYVDQDTTRELMKNATVAAMIKISAVGPFGVSTLPILPIESEHLRAMNAGDEFIEFIADARELGLDILIFNVERGT